MKMIGPENYLHRWTAPREKFNQRTGKMNGTSESFVERLVDFEVCALSVLGYLGSASALNEATLKDEAHALQCTTAGPNNAIPTDLLRAGSVRGLGLTDVGFASLASLPVSEQPPLLACSSMALPEVVQLVTVTVPLFVLPLPNGKNSFSKHQWRIAPRRSMSTCARWIVTELPTLPVIRSKRSPLFCSATRSKYVILLCRSLHVPPESWDRSAETPHGTDHTNDL